MQLREVNLNSQLKDRTMLEKQAEEMKTEVTTASQSFKVKCSTHRPASIGLRFC